MSSPESNFSAWLRKADHDLLNIRNNLAAKDIPWDTVCFHAQQAAEKVLKAFWSLADAICRKRTIWWPYSPSVSSAMPVLLPWSRIVGS
jgi:hypothetical protein